jgi:hypothetical protein
MNSSPTRTAAIPILIGLITAAVAFVVTQRVLGRSDTKRSGEETVGQMPDASSQAEPRPVAPQRRPIDWYKERETHGTITDAAPSNPPKSHTRAELSRAMRDGTAFDPASGLAREAWLMMTHMATDEIEGIGARPQDVLAGIKSLDPDVRAMSAMFIPYTEVQRARTGPKKLQPRLPSSCARSRICRDRRRRWNSCSSEPQTARITRDKPPSPAWVIYTAPGPRPFWWTQAVMPLPRRASRPMRPSRIVPLKVAPASTSSWRPREASSSRRRPGNSIVNSTSTDCSTISRRERFSTWNPGQINADQASSSPDRYPAFDSRRASLLQ